MDFRRQCERVIGSGRSLSMEDGKECRSSLDASEVICVRRSRVSQPYHSWVKLYASGRVLFRRSARHYCGKAQSCSATTEYSTPVGGKAGLRSEIAVCKPNVTSQLIEGLSVILYKIHARRTRCFTDAASRMTLLSSPRQARITPPYRHPECLGLYESLCYQPP